MNTENKKLSCDQVNEKDLVDYLSFLGYQPARIKSNDYWYLSPLRIEKNASFKVNRKLNCWYDHGLGKGGNLVDFGILYHHCSVKELLTRLDNNASFHQQHVNVIHQTQLSSNAIKIISETTLNSFTLLRYIRQRRVNEIIAKKYCREIIFELNDKRYSVLVFLTTMEVMNYEMNGSNQAVRQNHQLSSITMQTTCPFLKAFLTFYRTSLFISDSLFQQTIFSF